MSTWTSRHDGRGRTTFISYSPRAIEMFLPPGSDLRDREREGQLAGATLADGLWTWASWPRTDETILDEDRPARMAPMRTVEVLDAVGRGLHADIDALMREQLHYASMLSVPEPTRGVDEDRAHRHAPLVMALAGEYSEAFPGVTIWDPGPNTADLPDDWSGLLGDEQSAGSPPSTGESIAALTWALARTAWALTRAITGRLRHGAPDDQAAGTSVGQGPKRRDDAGDADRSGSLAARP